MSKCRETRDCSFYKKYEKEKKLVVINKFAKLFCLSTNMMNCVRLKLNEKFRSFRMVPNNMLPTGSPMVGTDTTRWDSKVFHNLEMLGVHVYRKDFSKKRINGK